MLLHGSFTLGSIQMFQWIKFSTMSSAYFIIRPCGIRVAKYMTGCSKSWRNGCRRSLMEDLTLTISSAQKVSGKARTTSSKERSLMVTIFITLTMVARVAVEDMEDVEVMEVAQAVEVTPT